MRIPLAAVAVLLSAAISNAQEQRASFFAVFEDGAQPTAVLTDDGTREPVFVGSGTIPPSECGQGSWFASTATSMKDLLVRCGSNETFVVNTDSTDKIKPLEKPGTIWPPPMGTQDDAK